MSNLTKGSAGPFTFVLILLLSLAVCSAGQTDSEPQLALKRVVGVEYPWFARMAVIQGRVELSLTISARGIVDDVRVVSGAEPLALAAKAALSKWQFTGCTSKQGHCETKFVILFVLNGSCYASENCPTDFEVDFPGKVTVMSKSIHAIVN